MIQIGTVAKERVAPGSKSDRIAVVLKTDSGSIMLRRVGGNPFQDPGLENLVGQTLRFEGDLHQGTLLFRRYEPVG